MYPKLDTFNYLFIVVLTQMLRVLGIFLLIDLNRFHMFSLKSTVNVILF